RREREPRSRPPSAGLPWERRSSMRRSAPRAPPAPQEPAPPGFAAPHRTSRPAQRPPRSRPPRRGRRPSDLAETGRHERSGRPRRATPGSPAATARWPPASRPRAGCPAAPSPLVDLPAVLGRVRSVRVVDLVDGLDAELVPALAQVPIPLGRGALPIPLAAQLALVDECPELRP